MTPGPYSRLLHRGVVLLGRVETGHSGDLHLAIDHVQRRVHVQRDRVDGSVARVDDVHADFALEHAVARVRVQVQPVTAGHDRAGRERGQQAHGRDGRRESTTRGHAVDGAGDGGGSVGGGLGASKTASRSTWAERITGRVDGPLRGCVCGGGGYRLAGVTGRVCDRSARRIRFEIGCRAERVESADDQTLEIDDGGDPRKRDDGNRRSGS